VTASHVIAGLSAWNVPLPITLNEHANTHFFLAGESSSIEGPWKSFPYQIGPLNWIGNDDIKIVTWRKATRVGYTKMIAAAVVYFAEHKKRNQLIYQPTDGDAKKFTEDEINPLLVKVPVMRNICKSDPEKKSGNYTTDRKKFIGSTLDILGGKTARNYRRMTKDVVYYDELSGFVANVDGEGSPTSLGDVRVQTSSFPKSVRGSNPKIKGSCLISSSLAEADIIMNRFLPCPHCGEMQYLSWRDEYDKKKYYFDFDSGCCACKFCGALISYSEYPDMDRAGQWRSADQSVYYDEELDGFFTAAGEKIPDPKHVGIDKLWSAYSYFMEWKDIIDQFRAAKKLHSETGDFTKLITFVNTALGEEWENKGEGVEAIAFSGDRLEQAQDTISSDVLFITMWADVQGGRNARLEYEVVGWGLGRESWSLDYGIIKGDIDTGHVWDNLDEVRKKKFTRGDGISLGVSCCGVDSGYKPDIVYKYTTPRQGQRVYATKGHSVAGKPIINGFSLQGPGENKKTRLYMIGADTAKDVLFSMLNEIKEPGQKFCHFPDHYEQEYFNQLTAEEKKPVRNKRTGRTTYEWVKIRTRNEALDCRVGNLAMVEILNPNLAKIKKRLDRKMEALSEPSEKPQTKEEPISARRKTKPARNKRGGFVNGWR